MTDRISRGYALGLSSHSSMQNSSEMFKKSEMFEISSICKNEEPEHISKDNIISEITHLACRFCGRNTDREQIIQVCHCPTKYSGHKSCMKALAEAKCKRCGTKWLKEASRRSPEILLSEGSPKLSSHSVINESSGEVRMKNIIKSSTRKPICRLCKEERETENNKIIYPCQCHTIDPKLAWAHRECALNMIIKQQKDECELCKAKFSFAPIYRSIWVCSEEEMYCEFISDIMKILVCIGTAAGMIILLVNLRDIYGDSYYESVWGIVLVVFLAILLVLLSVLLIRTLILKSTNKVIEALEVLCQKQEIAKMSSESHSFFMGYIHFLKKNKLITSIVVSKKESKETFCKHEESSARRALPRIILEMDTNGENIDSDLLREHSLVKSTNSFKLNNSEDFKEEDIREFSDTN